MKNKKEPVRYVVFFSPRSGSTLLCNLLENSGFGAYFSPASKEKNMTKRYEAFGRNLLKNSGFGAYFSPASKEKNMTKRYDAFGRKKISIVNLEKIDWDKTDLSDFLLKVFNASENHEGVQGFKITYAHLKYLVKIIRKYKRYRDTCIYNVLDYFPPNVKYIVCYRKNILEQAVSHALARKNNIWFQKSKEGTKKLKKDLDSRTLIDSLEYMKKSDKLNKDILRKNNVEFISVSYEELIKDKKSCLLKVINYLGFNISKVSVKEDLVKQSSIDSKSIFSSSIFYLNVHFMILLQRFLSPLFTLSGYLKKRSSLYTSLINFLKQKPFFR